MTRKARRITGPSLSLIVVIYKMPEQAKNTLFSLSLDYQHGIFKDDYEVIVVENASDQPLGKDFVQTLKGNFRYFYREEHLRSPVPAINFAASVAKGKNIGLMIDGARMATPGVIKHMLQAQRLSKNAVVAVPGYHLGKTVQQEAINSGYNEAVEKQLLESISWPEDGYRLFDIACTSATSRPGFFLPLGESNCISVPARIWRRVGGVDPRFDNNGGGYANLDFYKKVCDQPDTELILLAGEGTFHQYHGGVTTGTMGDERKKIMHECTLQYEAIRGERYRPPKRQALIFGSFRSPALRFMQQSVDSVKSKNGLDW